MLRLCKQFLKKHLSACQWEGLKTFKRRCHASVKRIGVFFINILPKRFLFFLKSNIQVLGKLDYDKRNIFLNVDSAIEHDTRLRSCRKEREMVNWIEHVFLKGEVFFDVGANVGAYSLVAAKFFQEDIRVYAFEPAFHNYAQLNKNIHINRCDGIVTAIPLALSDKTSLQIFNYSDIETGSAFNTLGGIIDYKGDLFNPIFRQEVLSFTLDDLIAYFNLPMPNHIKIDVDGCEFSILRGAQKTLASKNVRSVMIEIYEEGEQTQGIVKLLEGRGLKFHSKYKYIDGGAEGPTSKLYNYCFQREECPSQSVATSTF